MLKHLIWIVPGSIMGGEKISKEKARLRKGINLLLTTPGRLLYHLKNTECFKYDKLKFVIFEESDRTLDMGFKKEIEESIQILKSKIVAHLSNSSSK